MPAGVARLRDRGVEYRARRSQGSRLARRGVPGRERRDHDGVFDVVAAARRLHRHCRSPGPTRSDRRCRRPPASARFVLMSVPASMAVDFPLQSAKREVEARLQGSGMTYTILQPTLLRRGVAEPGARLRRRAATARIYGDGHIASAGFRRTTWPVHGGGARDAAGRQRRLQAGRSRGAEPARRRAAGRASHGTHLRRAARAREPRYARSTTPPPTRWSRRSRR